MLFKERETMNNSTKEIAIVKTLSTKEQVN